MAPQDTPLPPLGSLPPKKNSVVHVSFSGGFDNKESACSAGDSGLIPGLERSPGEGNGHPLQYSCLENPWTEEPGGLQSIGSQKVRHD